MNIKTKTQMKKLKILLKDMVECSTKDKLWIAKRREEEIIIFLKKLVEEVIE